MNVIEETLAGAAGDAELRATLEEGLSRRGGTPRRVVGLERRPSEYRSTFELEELIARLDDGTALRLVFKDLSWGRLLEGGRRVKPRFMYDPRREVETYRRVLGPHGVGSPACFGALVDEEAGRYWLLLEQVEGVELYQVGEFETWQDVARWLARLHARFAGRVAEVQREAHLLTYDRRFYRSWLERARSFLGDGSEEVRRDLALVGRGYERLVGHLLAMPLTFVHGEFYASNVLVRETETGLRVCPVDWEVAAAGPGLVDLAALVAGWGEKERGELSFAYFEELQRLDGGAHTLSEFAFALDCCRLFKAVQWVGSFGRRRQLSRHARDWLGEAAWLTQELGLAV